MSENTKSFVDIIFSFYKPEYVLDKLRELYIDGKSIDHSRLTSLVLGHISESFPSDISFGLDKTVSFATKKGIAGIDGVFLSLLSQANILLEKNPAMKFSSMGVIYTQAISKMDSFSTMLPDGVSRGRGMNILFFEPNTSTLRGVKDDVATDFFSVAKEMFSRNSNISELVKIMDSPFEHSNGGHDNQKISRILDSKTSLTSMSQTKCEVGWEIGGAAFGAVLVASGGAVLGGMLGGPAGAGAGTLQGFTVGAKAGKMIGEWIGRVQCEPKTSTPTPEKPTPEKPTPEKPAPEKPAPEKPTPEKPTPEKPAPEKPTPEKPEKVYYGIDDNGPDYSTDDGDPEDDDKRSFLCCEVHILGEEGLQNRKQDPGAFILKCIIDMNTKIRTVQNAEMDGSTGVVKITSIKDRMDPFILKINTFQEGERMLTSKALAKRIEEKMHYIRPISVLGDRPPGLIPSLPHTT